MRYLLLTVLTLASFAAGVGAERHRSGDQLKWLAYEVELLGAQVEVLLLRCKALELDAAEIRRANTKTFGAEHL